MGINGGVGVGIGAIPLYEIVVSRLDLFET